MEESTVETTTNERKRKGGIIAIILGLLLAGSAGANFWLWDKESKSSAQALAKVDSLSALTSLKDSLYKTINEEEIKVYNLRTELAMYQSENDSLRQLIQEKESKLRALRAAIGGGSPSKLRALKDSLIKLSAENAFFQSKVQAMILESEDYKAKLLEQQSKIETLEGQKQKLNDKVKVAAQPSVGPVIVTPMYQKKGVYVPIYKAKKVERLQITFDVLTNKLTEKTVEKEYIVRIINPDGIVLSTSNTSLKNSDEVYTIKESVDFNGTQQKIKVNYTQSPDYKKGHYKVELKEGDEVLQTFAFDLI